MRKEDKERRKERDDVRLKKTAEEQKKMKNVRKDLRLKNMKA